MWLLVACKKGDFKTNPLHPDKLRRKPKGEKLAGSSKALVAHSPSGASNLLPHWGSKNSFSNELRLEANGGE